MTGRALRRTVGVSASRLAADPGALVFTGGFYLMVTAVLSVLWSTAADGRDIAGYSAIALVWYVTASEAATIPLDYRLIEETGDDIGTGAIATELLRPSSVVGIRIALAVGQMLPKLVVCVALGLGFSTVVHGAPPSWPALALAAPSLLLALGLNIVGQHAFAAVAFWVDDAKSGWFLYQKVVFVLGGMLLPLEVLPAGIGDVARFLPPASMAYVPARLASGHVEPWLLGLQVAWLVVAVAVTVRLFAAGERRLQVVGG